MITVHYVLSLSRLLSSWGDRLWTFLSALFMLLLQVGDDDDIDDHDLDDNDDDGDRLWTFLSALFMLLLQVGDDDDVDDNDDDNDRL